MIRDQLESRGIKNKAVLKAMRKVPREKFVPKKYQDEAYSDGPLPIGYGQTISQPYIVALMTELLDLNEDSRVLEIGTGSGYQAVILAELAKEVYSIEIIKELYERATATLKELRYKNVKTKYGDGYLGWKEYAPFDAIIVTCAAEDIPKPLIDQLKIGGLMCIPVGEPYAVQKLILLEKKPNGKVEQKTITYVRFVPLQRSEE